MENRFGFKEFVLASLLVILIVIVLLAIKQYDRQHETLLTIKQQLAEQNAAQARLERHVGELFDEVETLVRREPVVVMPSDAQTSTQSSDEPAVPLTPDRTAALRDPFERLRQATEQPEFAPGDWMVDAFGANVGRVTPLISGDAYAARIQSFVLETLARRDPDTLEWQPLLAQSWQISEDGLTIMFRLRRGLTFADGHPLTAADVQYSFDLIMNEAIDAPRTRNFISDKMKSVVATGPYEVVFTFSEPYFNSFGLAASLEVLPKHFYETFTPDQINRMPGLLLGSGPYRLESPTDWSPGKPIVLLRNERYWGVRSAFDRLLFREITNEVARVTAFGNGEIDLLAAMPDQFIKLTADEDLMARSQAFDYESPKAGYGFIAWNQQRAGKPTPFADKRVRQAMTMLSDRQKMIDDVLSGMGFVVTGPFNRLSPQHNPDIEPWPYDVDRAKALLAEAGYRDRDGDGVIESESGEPFIFKFTFPSTLGEQGFWDKVILLMKDNYAEVGIVLELDPLEWSVFAEKLKAQDFDALSMAWGGGIEGDIRQMFHSSNIGQGADNWISYRNPELDRLIDQARATVDEAERMPIWQKAHAILHEDQPYTFLYSRRSLLLLDDRIRHVERVKLGINDRTEWFVPLTLQKY